MRPLVEKGSLLHSEHTQEEVLNCCKQCKTVRTIHLSLLSFRSSIRLPISPFLPGDVGFQKLESPTSTCPSITFCFVSGLCFPTTTHHSYQAIEPRPSRHNTSKSRPKYPPTTQTNNTASMGRQFFVGGNFKMYIPPNPPHHSHHAPF
jgi:hypothetical protein